MVDRWEAQRFPMFIQLIIAWYKRTNAHRAKSIPAIIKCSFGVGPDYLHVPSWCVEMDHVWPKGHINDAYDKEAEKYMYYL